MPAPPLSTRNRRPPAKSSLLTDAALRPLEEVIDQLGTGVTHFHVEGLDPAGEIVERPHRGDGHEQTDGGGDKGFGNTAGHSAETGGLLRRNALERVDDARDGTEPTDERGGRSNGRQTRYAALQFSVHDGFGAL